MTGLEEHVILKVKCNEVIFHSRKKIKHYFEVCFMYAKTSRCKSVGSANFPAYTVQFNSIFHLLNLVGGKQVKISCILSLFHLMILKLSLQLKQLIKFQPTCPDSRKCYQITLTPLSCIDKRSAKVLVGFMSMHLFHLCLFLIVMQSPAMM